MRFHLVQARTWEAERVPPPAVDLAGCSSPEHLIKENVRLE